MSTYLLIHGACHGGWCWDELAVALQSAGHQVIAPDLPCDVLDADIERCAEVACDAVNQAGSVNEGLVVVGHSLGGLTAPAVACILPTSHLVFLAGVVGAPGRSLRDLASEDADRELPLGDDSFERDGARRIRFTPETARRVLYHDCDPRQAEAAIARLRFQRSTYNDVAPFDAWPATEITSIVCRDDRVISPEWSRRIARSRLGVEPTEMDGGHMAMMSRPVELAALLTRAVG